MSPRPARRGSNACGGEDGRSRPGLPPHRLDGERPAPGRGAHGALAPQRPGARVGASRETHGPDRGRPARLGLAQPAAALATAPVDGAAAAPDPGAVADRRRGRLERPEDRESRRVDVEAPLGRFGLHAGVPIGPARQAAAGRPRGKSSGSAQGHAPPPPRVHMESRSTVSAAVRTVLPSIEIHRAYISSPARSPNTPGTEPSSSTSTPRQRLQLARPSPGRRPRTPRRPAGSRQPPRTNARPNGAAGCHALRDRHRSALRRRRLHGGRRRRPHPHPRPALRSPTSGPLHQTIRIAESAGTPATVVINRAIVNHPTIAQSHRILAAADVAICPVTLHQRIAHSAFNSGRCAAETEPATKAAVELVQLYEWLVSARALPQADTKETA